MRLNEHSFGTPVSPASKVTKNRLRLRGAILDIASLPTSSDLSSRMRTREKAASHSRSVLLSPDSSKLPLACDDVLYLGERETSPLVCHSRVYFSRYFSNGELAGRLGLFFLSVKLSSWGWNLKCLLCLVFPQNIPKTTIEDDIIFQEINLNYFQFKMLKK